MEIVKNREGNTLILELEGRLDTVTAPELQAQLEEFSGISELVIDMARLIYISSAGLRVLLMAQKAMSSQGSMVIRHANKTIMEVFEVSGFSKILTIEN